MGHDTLVAAPRASAGVVWNDRLAPYWIFFGTFLIAMAFALYTRLAWDDWHITFRASKNLAFGNGPMLTPGERIHSFTSPLETLVPAFLSAATGNAADDAVLPIPDVRPDDLVASHSDRFDHAPPAYLPDLLWTPTEIEIAKIEYRK